MQDIQTVPGTDYDAIVIGGSFAGLSAAMQLARARRKILVLDAGKPRNRFAPASHGFLGQDGRAPREIMEIARKQLMAYPTVHFQKAEAKDAAQVRGGFAVAFGDGCEAQAKSLVLATGMVDHLPDVPGMQELWGEGVNSCPYCHGYEVADRKLAVFGVSEMSVHYAALIRDWSDDVTLLTQGGEWLTAQHRVYLRARDVQIEETPLVRLIPKEEGPHQGELDAAELRDGQPLARPPHATLNRRELGAIEFRDGRRVPYGALFTGTRTSFASPLAERLGCEITQALTGPMVKTDATKETRVPGVFVAGDAALPVANATLASADGVMAGASAHRSMIPELP